MENIETPNGQDINIISSENSKTQNNQFDAQQYFLDPENNEENNNQTEQPPIIIKDNNKCCGICCIILLILPMTVASISMIIGFFDTGKIVFIILEFVIIIFFAFFIFLILIKCGKKLVFSKNIEKNKFYIERFNFLNSPIKNLELSLGNYYIKCIKKYNVDNEGHNHITYKIHLYNQLIDTSEINLDTTKIKEVPIILFCIFNISLIGLDAENQLQERLNNFICAKNFKNPFSFNIGNYMNKQENKNKYYIDSFMSRTKYIKYSDYFFTFYLNCYTELLIEEINGVIRIDFIYSENFDRIFIGIVKKMKNLMLKLLNLKWILLINSFYKNSKTLKLDLI